jgi:hypothetical protein
MIAEYYYLANKLLKSKLIYLIYFKLNYYNLFNFNKFILSIISRYNIFKKIVWNPFY